MHRDPDCVFCKIVAGDIPCHIVFQSREMLAFLDIGPLADGHVLLVPEEHYETIIDLSAEMAAELAKTMRWLGKALLTVTGATGFNVLQNNGAVAGQVVNHVHFHLIPRFEGDGLGYRWNAGSYEPGRAETLASAYQEALRRDP